MFAAAPAAIVALVLMVGVFWALGFIPAGLFAFLAWTRRSKWDWVHRAALVWALAAVWEAIVQGLWCKGSALCHIRPELVLIFPVAILSSVFAVWRLVNPEPNS